MLQKFLLFLSWLIFGSLSNTLLTLEEIDIKRLILIPKLLPLKSTDAYIF